VRDGGRQLAPGQITEADRQGERGGETLREIARAYNVSHTMTLRLLAA
jgi:hypothetical protein